MAFQGAWAWALLTPCLRLLASQDVALGNHCLPLPVNMMERGKKLPIKVRPLLRIRAKSCPTLCDAMDCSTPGFPVLCHLPEFAQIHVH